MIIIREFISLINFLYVTRTILKNIYLSIFIYLGSYFTLYSSNNIKRNRRCETIAIILKYILYIILMYISAISR